MPSMVNNVTVTQTAPAPPAPPSAPVAPPAPAVATGHVGGLGTLVRALYFLGSGLALGVVWTAAVQAATAPYSNQPWAIPLAIALTILLLLLNIVVLNRLAHRR
jgi:ABC-type dipeptide/oligopeptide/nickel transport system permease subunit